MVTEMIPHEYLKMFLDCMHRQFKFRSIIGKHLH